MTAQKFHVGMNLKYSVEVFDGVRTKSATGGNSAKGVSRGTFRCHIFNKESSQSEYAQRPEHRYTHRVYMRRNPSFEIKHGWTLVKGSSTYYVKKVQFFDADEQWLILDVEVGGRK